MVAVDHGGADGSVAHGHPHFLQGLPGGQRKGRRRVSQAVGRVPVIVDADGPHGLLGNPADGAGCEPAAFSAARARRGKQRLVIRFRTARRQVVADGRVNGGRDHHEGILGGVALAPDPHDAPVARCLDVVDVGPGHLEGAESGGDHQQEHGVVASAGDVILGDRREHPRRL